MRNPFEQVVYQIYPRSFQDSDGDGIGDINGITMRLDYLSDLGVDLLWLTPIYPSPGRDNGYDVADYMAIDPLFGTMDDFRNLVHQAGKKNIGIMLDMVFNHTSTKHPWFQKALSGDPEYMDYYIFKDTPTNWESKFGGSAWEFVPSLNKYYLHLFDVMQADLNWENPKVRHEIQTIVNFWLDLGVKGLRFDVINLISKPEVFHDSQGDGRDLYTDGPRVHQYLQELNQKTFGNHDIVTVGELSSTSIQQACLYANPDNHELSTVFGFHHLKIDYAQNQKWVLQDPDFTSLKTILKSWQEGLATHNAVMALFWCNHDQPRIVSRLGDDRNFPYESASVLATMMHLLKGMPYIYQGEEIGLPNAYFSALAQYRDVESLNYAKILEKSHTQDEVLTLLQARSRDNARTPIPWDDTVNYGFSPVTPWIDFSNHPDLKTVATQRDDHHSIYYWYKALIALRHQHDVVAQGDVVWVESDATSFHFKRVNKDERWLILNNIDKQPKVFELDGTYDIIMSNYQRDTLTPTLTLQPYESLILRQLNF